MRSKQSCVVQSIADQLLDCGIAVQQRQAGKPRLGQQAYLHALSLRINRQSAACMQHHVACLCSHMPSLRGQCHGRASSSMGNGMAPIRPASHPTCLCSWCMCSTRSGLRRTMGERPRSLTVTTSCAAVTATAATLCCVASTFPMCSRRTATARSATPVHGGHHELLRINEKAAMSLTPGKGAGPVTLCHKRQPFSCPVTT